MKYQIVVGNSYGNGLEKFEKRINEMLIEGWQLQGGVSVCEKLDEFDNSLFIYYQAMIRDESA